MPLTLDQIKQLYRFQVEEVLFGEEVIKAGKCSRWARKKEQKQEKDIVYLRLRGSYHGAQESPLVYLQFYLEDSERYFGNAMPSDDYLDCTTSSGESFEGELLFSLCQDVTPARLWFDTKITYENSKDPILLDIALPLESSRSRTQCLVKEELIDSYTREIKKDLNESHITPRVETETIIRNVSQECGVPYRKIPNGYLLKLSLAEGRKQNIIVNFAGKDSFGNDLVTIATLCAETKKKLERSLLKINPKLPYGAVGISTIKGKHFYVITQTYPVSIIHRLKVAQIVQEIATKGDWLERKLNAGQDRH